MTEKAPTPSPASQQRKSGGFWPLVLGGVVAGAIGFVISEANLLQLRSESDNLAVMVEEQQAAIEALQNAPVQTAPAEPVDLSGIESTLADLRASIDGIDRSIEGLDGRISALELRPTGGGAGEPDADYSAALAALQSSINAQKAEIDAQRTEIEGLIANARSVEAATADAARAAAGQNALARITAALASGASYDDEVAALREAGVENLPDALTAPAETGVTTLANLQARFPEVARDALAAARAADGQEAEDGFGGFLRRQLGARSVTPREGNDPDAVLSRAEASVRDGRIAEALAEAENLPEAARAAMKDWLTDARALADARSAAQELSQRLTAN
ncbi:MAG: hypothetical protein HKN30_06470 [Sulfitobacter sp.]|nr:hypothetical protein [Sulfitobacter sp.]